MLSSIGTPTLRKWMAPFISHETRYMANVRHDALCVGETGASWRTGQDDESALVLKMITTLHLSVCHTFQHGCAQLISA